MGLIKKVTAVILENNQHRMILHKQGKS